MRSSIKPLLAVAFVRSGAMEKYNISLKELSIVCSSHAGQAFHRRIVRSILKKVGLSERDLDCGHKYPENENAKNAIIKLGKRPDPIFSCCSGKHASMLALCRYYDFPTDGYIKPDHPVQQLMRNTMAEILECEFSDIIIGMDGCSIPTYLLTMHQAAYAYSLLAHGYEGKTKLKDYFGLIQKAMVTYPRNINGDDTFCTDITHHTKGRVIGKLGAEGVYMLAVPEKRIGISIKMSDGHPWSSYPVAVRILEELEMLDEKTVKKLDKWALPQVLNDKGDVVGYLHPTFSILTKEVTNFKPGDLYPARGELI
jgi:L-asparaginase II